MSLTVNLVMCFVMNLFMSAVMSLAMSLAMSLSLYEYRHESLAMNTTWGLTRSLKLKQPNENRFAL